MGSSDWDPDYKLPGNKKVYVTLFWCSNYDGHKYEACLDRAETMLKEHNIGLDIYPGKKRVKEHEIDIGSDVLPASRRNEMRRKAHAKFDDQKAGSKIQRLPIFMCQFVGPAYGLTILRGKDSPWLEYVMIDHEVNQDNSTILHEIGHAAAKNAAHSPQKGNFMHVSSYPERTIMVKAQIQQLARAYFVR